MGISISKQNKVTCFSQDTGFNKDNIMFVNIYKEMMKQKNFQNIEFC